MLIDKNREAEKGTHKKDVDNPPSVSNFCSCGANLGGNIRPIHIYNHICKKEV
jgi:hypothetical protein